MKADAKWVLVVASVTVLGGVAGRYLSPQKTAESLATTSPSSLTSPGATPPGVGSGRDQDRLRLLIDSNPADSRDNGAAKASAPGASSTARPGASAERFTEPPATRPQARKPKKLTEEDIAHIIIDQNESWLFQRDRQGKFVVGPDGHRVVTPLGQRYAAHIVKAVELGLRSSIEQHDFAIKRLLLEVKQASDAARRRQALVAGRSDTRLYPDLRLSKVAVFANGFYCQRVAADILRANSIAETPIRSADVILVVVRNPFSISTFRYSYDSPAELKREAEFQLNLAGSYGHIYVYSIDSRFRLAQLFHTKTDWETLELVAGR